MKETLEQQIARMEAEYEAVRAATVQVENELLASKETAVSRDRTVEVTVGPQGNLTAVKFLDGKHRTMSATALSAAVLEAAEKARERMTRRVADTFQGLAQSMPGLGGGLDLDLDRLLGLSADGRGVPAKRPARPLHDELHED
ncbi:YbaB/EbfC family nucleoid-associated protein [Streptomyces sp. NPDC094143]|uniref:YbaB/EbfC family nucleoid-associated protein n=1 Tax=Streptomyces sp. NPDC094143 TaxID=3155310 RepID=UPI003324D525